MKSGDYKKWILENSVIVGAILSVIVVSAAAYWVFSNESRNRRAQVQERAHLISTILEEEVINIFDFVESYLTLVRNQYYEDRNVESIKNLLDIAPINERSFSHLTLIDRDGTPTFNSRYVIRPGSSAADREYFKHFQKNDTDELYISLPHVGRNSNKVVVRAVKRLEDPDGNFDGVIFIAIDVDRLVRFFKELDLGENSSATIVGLDKRIRSRSHYGELGPGQDISGSRIWKELEKRPTGSYRQTSVVDQVERLYTYRKLEDYLLIVAIGVPVNFVGKLESDISWLASSFTGIAITIVLLLSVIAVRESIFSRRLRKSNTAKDEFLGQSPSIKFMFVSSGVP